MKRLIPLKLFLFAASAFATVVIPVGAASQILIPAAGSTAGANGTFFQSDITLINLSSHDHMVSMQWLPQGATGNGIAPKTTTIPARTGIRAADFVRTYLQQTGLGSIVIKGITTGGAIDQTAVLFASARIWTPEPGTNGTTSQSFPVIPMDQVSTPAAAIFSMGSIVNPTNYRVNVGVVNVDAVNAQTFSINVPNNGTTTQPPPPAIVITVPPMSMQQVAVTIDTSGGGISQINVTNVTPSATASNFWTAYGSTIDNVTGDAWSEMAVAGTTTAP